VTSRLSLLPGCYSISAGILDPQGLRPLDLQRARYPFTVVSTRRDFGFVYLEHEWRHTAAEPAAASRRDAAGAIARRRRRAGGAWMIADSVVLESTCRIPQPGLVNLYGCRSATTRASARSSRASAAP
jgi:hypothetical protein